jgi:uncharacterized surface protein with fasciclin (FAS1) repeats
VNRLFGYDGITTDDVQVRYCIESAASMLTAWKGILLADIVHTIVSDQRFMTLATAVKAAHLVDILTSDGPFTFFAPTDDAFARLPRGTVAELLRDAPSMGAVLRYHVLCGQVMMADLVKLQSASTLDGVPLKIAVEGGQIWINASRVIGSDIEVSNGVIHVVDRVLLLPDE